ncbi:endonuclease/exonuclease/phosphatase family protein [Jatrophihabitans sp. YIM 134969]
MFTVMSWNVENLFVPQADEREAYEAKIAALAAVVHDAAPDLLGVQEIGDPESFEALRAALAAGGSGDDWHGTLSTRFEADHAIRVGWLSPRALSDVEQVARLPVHLRNVQVDDDGTRIDAMPRGALAVTATTTGGTPVRALTAHLKSKLLSFPGGRFDTRDEGERARYAVYALDRRAAEAATLRAWTTATLEAGDAGGRVVVCGDLNDTSEAATTQLIFGPPGSQIGTGGFDHPDRGDTQRLWDTGYAMTPPDDFSRVNEGRKELIDHVLVSHALVGSLQSARTVPLEVPSVGVRPRVAPRVTPAPSDHRPVVAVFDLD